MLEDDFVVRPRTTARSRLHLGPVKPRLEFKTEENKCWCSVDLASIDSLLTRDA